MAEEELELDVNQPKSNKLTTILLIVLIVLVLVVSGVGAWLLLGNDSGSETASDSSSKTIAEENQPLHYLSLVPEFVVNFGPDSKVRYLQVDLQVATRDKAALAIINTYRPVIRNDILVLLSDLTFDELKMRSGKESLQKKLLNTINRVIADTMHSDQQKEEHAKNSVQDNTATSNEHDTQDKQVEGPIENVYFTSFIMQ